jgi:hypothetical protein
MLYLLGPIPETLRQLPEQKLDQQRGRSRIAHQPETISRPNAAAAF